MDGLRPFCWDDLDAYAGLLAASRQEDGIDEVVSSERLRHQLSTPGFEGEKSIFVLEKPLAPLHK
jgi:hypothetical protein